MTNPGAADHQDAFTLDEFCERHRISRSMFYKLRDQGLAPATFMLGNRVRISREAAAKWRKQRERENAAA
jgi:excisionase family DNA binding protein